MRTESLYQLRQRITEELRASHPGKFNLSVPECAATIGQSAGHIRNQISQKKFPIKTIQLGGSRLVPVIGIADYLAEQIVEQNRRQPRIGRPTKKERRLRAEAAQENHAQ